jgi:hypothetical protein
MKNHDHDWALPRKPGGSEEGGQPAVTSDARLSQTLTE